MVTVLIHVESQAYQETDFARRMFIYFSRLYEEHRKKSCPSLLSLTTAEPASQPVTR